MCREDARFFWQRIPKQQKQASLIFVGAFVHDLCRFGAYTLTGVRPWLQNPELLAAFGILQQLWNKDYEVGFNADGAHLRYSLDCLDPP